MFSFAAPSPGAAPFAADPAAAERERLRRRQEELARAMRDASQACLRDILGRRPEEMDRDWTGASDDLLRRRAEIQAEHQAVAARLAELAPAPAPVAAAPPAASGGGGGNGNFGDDDDDAFPAESEEKTLLATADPNWQEVSATDGASVVGTALAGDKAVRLKVRGNLRLQRSTADAGRKRLLMYSATGLLLLNVKVPGAHTLARRASKKRGDLGTVLFMGINGATAAPGEGSGEVVMFHVSAPLAAAQTLSADMGGGRSV